MQFVAQSLTQLHTLKRYFQQLTALKLHGNMCLYFSKLKSSLKIIQVFYLSTFIPQPFGRAYQPAVSFARN